MRQTIHELVTDPEQRLNVVAAKRPTGTQAPEYG